MDEINISVLVDVACGAMAHEGMCDCYDGRLLGL
jgi:hypothetical protein